MLTRRDIWRDMVAIARERKNTKILRWCSTYLSSPRSSEGQAALIDLSRWFDAEMKRYDELD